MSDYLDRRFPIFLAAVMFFAMFIAYAVKDLWVFGLAAIWAFVIWKGATASFITGWMPPEKLVRKPLLLTRMIVELLVIDVAAPLYFIFAYPGSDLLSWGIRVFVGLAFVVAAFFFLDGISVGKKMAKDLADVTEEGIREAAESALDDYRDYVVAFCNTWQNISGMMLIVLCLLPLTWR